MIVSQFIKAVYVYRDYMQETEFNVSFDQFKHLGAECGENRKDMIHLTINIKKQTCFCKSARGGPEETRTLDLSDANRTLSQLSYRPIAFIFLYYITNLEFVNSKNKPQCERAIPKTK